MYKFIVFLCLMPGLALAQLAGIVTDKNTREPLLGATLYLRDLKKVLYGYKQVLSVRQSPFWYADD